MQEGLFPEDMKQADVIPLHKSKEKHIGNNYRPISLLVTVSKILEKIIYARSYNFLCNTLINSTKANMALEQVTPVKMPYVN